MSITTTIYRYLHVKGRIWSGEDNFEYQYPLLPTENIGSFADAARKAGDFERLDSARVVVQRIDTTTEVEELLSE